LSIFYGLKLIAVVPADAQVIDEGGALSAKRAD
jgi:hypothetical protein